MVSLDHTKFPQKSLVGKMCARWLDLNGLDRIRSDADSGSSRDIPGWRGK